MIRPATESDLPSVLQVYAAARAFMKRSGNPTQWGERYPTASLLEEDIRQNRLYVATDPQGRIWGSFVLAGGPDKTYRTIQDGSWGQDAPYGVLHRVASDGTVHGLVDDCVAYATKQYSYLRIDTHANNLPMQRAVEKLGFVRRGIIYVEDGTPRIAYDR